MQTAYAATKNDADEKGFFGKVWDGIKDVANKVWDGITSIFDKDDKKDDKKDTKDDTQKVTPTQKDPTPEDPTPTDYKSSDTDVGSGTDVQPVVETPKGTIITPCGNYNDGDTVYHGDTTDPDNPTNDNVSNDKYFPSFTPLEPFDFNAAKEEARFRLLAKLTTIADKEMAEVVQDMITHAMDGTGTPYSNPVLTDRFIHHEKTQALVDDMTEQLRLTIADYGTDILNSPDFNEAYRAMLDEDNVYLSTYSPSANPLKADVWNGLTIAVHQWTSCNVNVTEYHINADGSVSGTLHFDLIDTFGVDDQDKWYNLLPGFNDWYNLQHYIGFDSNYKPFDTVVSFDTEFHF